MLVAAEHPEFLSALNASIILTANTGKRQTSQFLEMLSRSRIVAEVAMNVGDDP